MDQHTINRIAHIRQQEILQSAAAQGETELQPWLKSAHNFVSGILRQTNDIAERIDAADHKKRQAQTDCPPIESRPRSLNGHTS